MQTIISENVKRLRKEQKLTQWELAKLAGVSQATVSRIEDGGRVPRVDIIQKLAKALGQTPESLVKGAMERAKKEAQHPVSDEPIVTYMLQEQRDRALEGWGEAIQLCERINKDSTKFIVVFFILGLLLGASTLMLVVGLLS